MLGFHLYQVQGAKGAPGGSFPGTGVAWGEGGVLQGEGEGNGGGLSLTRCIQLSRTLNGMLKTVRFAEFHVASI